MDFRKRDRMVEGCNWLMVGVAAGWVAYTFAGSFSSPAGSQASLLPAEIVQPAPLPMQAVPVPVWGSGDSTASPSNPALDRAARPSRASSAASRSDRPPPAPQERGPARFRDGAPHVFAPEVPIPPLSTLPPGVGPDF